MYRSKLIKIDSSKCERYFNSFQTNFSFTIDPTISVLTDEVIIYSLINAWIPYSFYAINQYNQYLDIQMCFNNIVTNSTFIIPSGNYNVYDLAKVIALSNNRLSITYNKINNTYTFIYTSPSANDYLTILFSTGLNSHRSSYKLLGFSESDEKFMANTSYVSGMLLMNDIAYFQIKSDLGNSDNIITGDEHTSLLEIIPISSEPLSYISYAPYQPNKFMLHNNSLTEIKIALLDNYGRDVDLNGISFLLTIKIDILSSENAGLTKKITSREEMESHNQQKQTNLEIIRNQPSIISMANENSQLSVNDYLEYQILKQELMKVKKTKKRK